MVNLCIVNEGHPRCTVPRKAIKACQGRGWALSRGLSLVLLPSLTERVAMPSLFLHRISVVHVNLSIAATTHGSKGWGLHQFLKTLLPQSPPPSPLVIVRLFLISMSLVIFCLLFSFVDYIPVKGEIIWYLSLTACLISLSIMLSSSIHAVAKGISSFFPSAA